MRRWEDGAATTGWPARVSGVALCLYFLVAHGCHGDDVDHELLLTPPKKVESIQADGQMNNPRGAPPLRAGDSSPR